MVTITGTITTATTTTADHMATTIMGTTIITATTATATTAAVANTCRTAQAIEAATCPRQSVLLPAAGPWDLSRLLMLRRLRLGGTEAGYRVATAKARPRNEKVRATCDGRPDDRPPRELPRVRLVASWLAATDFIGPPRRATLAIFADCAEVRAGVRQAALGLTRPVWVIHAVGRPAPAGQRSASVAEACDRLSRGNTLIKLHHSGRF